MSNTGVRVPPSSIHAEAASTIATLSSHAFPPAQFQNRTNQTEMSRQSPARPPRPRPDRDQRNGKITYPQDGARHPHLVNPNSGRVCSRGSDARPPVSPRRRASDRAATETRAGSGEVWRRRDLVPRGGARGSRQWSALCLCVFRGRGRVRVSVFVGVGERGDGERRCDGVMVVKEGVPCSPDGRMRRSRRGRG